MLKAHEMKPVRDTHAERQKINPRLENKKRLRNVPPQTEFPIVATTYVPFCPSALSLSISSILFSSSCGLPRPQQLADPVPPHRYYS